MRSTGIIVHDRILDTKEYIQRLQEKLQEECQEVMTANTPKEVCEECADVLEVILCLLSGHGLTLADVQEVVAEHKNVTKGDAVPGFMYHLRDSGNPQKPCLL